MDAKKSDGSKSEAVFQEISALVPGGVDGNAKRFPGSMPVIARGEGCRLIDVDGNAYIDYCAGYGPLVFGHSDQELVAALKKQLDSGMLYGLPHPLMYQAASLVCELVPCAEMVRFTNSGTEATLNAIRLARGVTRRDKIVKFYGAYHGTHESVLIGTKIIDPHPPYPAGEANSAGIPSGVMRDTFVLPFNDIEMAAHCISQRAEEIAAVLVEPVLGGHGIVAEASFLEALRALTKDNGILLIFDEIITGFRLAVGGAQEVFGIIPDIVTLGKTMGGGFPVAAFAGAANYMQQIVPTGSAPFDAKNVVYHSGTYNANPMGLTAVTTALTKLKNESVYSKINSNGDKLRNEVVQLLRQYGIKGTVEGLGSIIHFYFGIEGRLRSLSDTLDADRTKASEFHASLLRKGIFFIGEPRGFVSTAHEDNDIDRTLECIEDTLKEMMG